jgi:hypothetical protein
MNHLSAQPNANGWYNDSVIVTPTCSDDLSGIASCSPPSTLASEGANQRVMSSAVDNAGNAASAATTMNIDKTAPVITGLSWTNNPKTTLGPATLMVHSSDNLSGVAGAEYFIGDADPGAGHGTPMPANGDAFTAIFGTDLATGVYKINVRVEDAAGNWSAASSDYLVVYDPFSMRMTGRKTIVPSLAGGDSLPGLASVSQDDAAKFVFSVGYDRKGRSLADSLQFTYSTGTNCKKPAKAQNCHSFALNATSVSWFTVQGTNSSIGSFAGTADVVIDGTTQQVTYLLSGLDGERLSPSAADHFTLKVFHPGTDVFRATPLYQASGDVVRGNIHIKT